jgi:hypothetical protein
MKNSSLRNCNHDGPHHNALSEKPVVQNFMKLPSIASDNALLSIDPELEQTVGRSLGYQFEAVFKTLMMKYPGYMLRFLSDELGKGLQ